MGKPGIRPIRMSRSLCCIEVTRDRNDPPTYVQCLISLTGHPSTFARTWPMSGEPVNDAQVKDIMAWIETTVYNALALSVGVQQSFGGDDA